MQLERLPEHGSRKVFCGGGGGGGGTWRHMISRFWKMYDVVTRTPVLTGLTGQEEHASERYTPQS